MKSTYDNDELFDIERTLVETIARSMDALNVDGTERIFLNTLIYFLRLLKK